MESISNIVKRIIDSKPFIHEAVIRGIVSYGNLAEMLIPDIKKSYEGDIKQSAVVMALRRYGEELKKREQETLSTNLSYEISIKTNILDVNIVKKVRLLQKVNRLYQSVSVDRGDFLNITIGTNEIGIAISEKYSENLDLLLEDEQVIHRRKDLVALTVLFSGDFLHTPGIIYEAVRQLAWEQINVIEIVSTMNELTFVIKREDSSQAYEVLQTFL